VFLDDCAVAGMARSSMHERCHAVENALRIL
jgi:hypothetical protein